MNAIFDFIPYFCPNCGKPLIGQKKGDGTWNPVEDYNAYASHLCLACKLTYQRCETSILLDAADKTGGDMKRCSEYEVAL